VEVNPRSIKHKSVDSLDCSAAAAPQPFRLGAENPELSIIYSYSVTFKASGACVP
jgi:hypothetical protein